MKISINKVRLIVVVATILTAVFFSSCSPYAKLMKGTDVQKQYSEALRYYEIGKYDKAITLFDKVMPNFIGTQREDSIVFFTGMSYFKSSQYDMAEEFMNTYRSRFPRSTFTQQSEYAFAYSIYYQTLQAERDQSYTRRAIIAFNEYLNGYPQSEHVEEINRVINELTFRLYEKSYHNAALYYKLEKYNSAITSLKAVLKDYPENPHREDILFLITQSWFSYAKGSIFSKQLDRYIKTIDSYYNFVSEFPNSKKYGKQIEQMYKESVVFTEKYGTKSQLAAKNLSVIESNKVLIEQAREKLFAAETKEERAKLKSQIKQAKLDIKKEKQQMKKETSKSVLKKMADVQPVATEGINALD